MPRLKQPEVDRVIGQNIRLARMQMSPRVSQGALGEALGCSFQQVQKYEQGRDTVSAPTLLRLSHVFERPLEAFFAGITVGKVV